MMGYKIGFKGVICETIRKLSLLPLLIWSTDFCFQIVPDGAASKTLLRIGDRILEVNNKDLTSATHQEAVMALIAPTYEIRVKVRHDPPPKGLQV